MDKQTFMNIEIDKISHVYKGKRDCCRCGCGGDYISTSFAERPNEVNDKLVARRLQQAKVLLQNGADYDEGDNYLDVETGDNKTLTFYFDELKK